MASIHPTFVLNNQMAQFDFVVTQIHQTFDPLIEELIARRDALLLKLSQLREDYTSKETTRRTAIEEIEKAQQHMQLLSMKVNINLPIHKQASDAYKQGLQQLESPTIPTCPIFKCLTRHNLKSLISEFGEVLEKEVPLYSSKKIPVQTAGKFGKNANEFQARGIAIDEDTQLIFIADCLNNRVSIVSLKGQFITTFGKELERPWAIAVTNEHIYITDVGIHALLKFDKNSYQLVRRTGSRGHINGLLNYPYGLCIDYNGDVIVADSSNNRVSVFSQDLKFIYNIGIGQLTHPVDVKLTLNCVVVVLDRGSKCVHFFSKDGHLDYSYLSRGEGPYCLVNNPYFFCLDPTGNVIISDFSDHIIKIISKSEQLIHTIGKEGEGRGEFTNPFGICITKLETIFVISDNTNFSIQAF